MRPASRPRHARDREETMGTSETGTIDLQARAARLEAIGKELIGKGVRFVQMEFVDVNGTVRGKLSPVEQALSPAGFGISSLIQTILSGDNICLSPFGNFDNGFPKLCVLPDPESFRQWSWKPDTASVLCDLREESGAPARIDPRHMLRTAEEGFRALGIEVKAALEYEFFLFHNDDQAIRQGRYDDLTPFGRSAAVYNLATYPSFVSFAEALFSRSAALGLNIEAFHTEYGEGMYEYVHGISSALTAADGAARGKLCIKQLAQQHDLVATYMPAIGRLESDTASGAHHNISLWRDGQNLMWDAETGSLSPTARQFAAGILDALPDLHLIFRPWVNSYRRMDRWHFSPENASWGLDHHTAALRVVHGALPPKYSRIEVRVPGADVSPHLSMAALLLSGLRGIRNGMEPPPYSQGDPVESGGGEMFPRTYRASIERFEASPIAREILGDTFVNIFALTRKSELEAYETWCRESSVDPDAAHVTPWEKQHYFEWA